MIITQLIGGLGNQLFQYAAGRALSLKSNQTFKIDKSSFDEYKLHEYSLYKTNAIENFASKNDLNKFYKDKRTFVDKIQNSLSPFQLIYEKGFNFDPSILDLKGHVYLQGYWQSYKYFKEYLETIKKEAQIKIQPDRINSKLIDTISQKESICLHIRRADYVNNVTTNKVHGTCSIEYYNRAIKIISAKTKDPYFYIFSDDYKWAKENIKNDINMEFIHHNDKAHDYEDFRLMYSCKHFIIANSSFSWWTAFLGSDKKKIVIAPEKWFQDNTKNTTDLIPNSWQKI